MTVTWSPTDIGAHITLSNGNLTATDTSTGDTLGRATASFSSGKLYFEAVWNVDAFSGQSGIIGWASGAAATNAVLGNAANGTNSIGVRSGGIVFDFTFGQGGGTFSVGDRIGFAFDIGNFKFWWRNVTVAPGTWFPSGDPGAGTGGYSSTNDANFVSTTFTGPYFPAYSFSDNNDQNTIYFSPSGFLGTIPSGFVAVDPGVSLAGQSAASAQGAIKGAPAPTLAGQQAIAAQGAITLSGVVRGATISGLSMGSSIGAILAGIPTPNITVPLPGMGMTALQGQAWIDSSLAIPQTWTVEDRSG